MGRETKAQKAEWLAREATQKAQRAEIERQWEVAEKRVAKILAAQPLHLIGQDIPHQMCAEEHQYWGEKARWDTLRLLAMDGASDEVLRDLVAGSDALSSDRMTAAWWNCLRVPMVKIIRNSDIDGYIRSVLFCPIEDLVADGLMMNDVIPLLRGDNRDVWRHERERRRRDVATQAEMIRRIAEG